MDPQQLQQRNKHELERNKSSLELELVSDYLNFVTLPEETINSLWIKCT